MVEEVNKEDEDTATEVPEPLEDGEFDEELQLEEAVDDEVIDVEDESAAAAGAPSSTSSSCSSCIRVEASSIAASTVVHLCHHRSIHSMVH